MNDLTDPSERVLVKYPLFKSAVARIRACFDSYGTTAEPDCCPIVGESGSGKTTIISYFASQYPRVDHKRGVEVPVLLAKVPARPTYRAFLRAVQEQLSEYVMPPLADLDLAFRMHYGSYGLIGYTMKIIIEWSHCKSKLKETQEETELPCRRKYRMPSKDWRTRTCSGELISLSW